MTVNLKSIRTQVLINNGINDLDVSAAFVALSLSAGAWDETGWFRLRGSLQLAAYVAGFDESFDCRNNELRWAPGNVVSVSLWFGAWVPLPTRIRILRYPNRPYPGNRIITLEVGSDGDLLNYRAKEGDPTGIEYGTPTGATSLVNAALARAGAPALASGNLIDYLLPFSPEKQDGGSWITYAGQVAYVGRRVLWQQADGSSRASELTMIGLEPFAHYVVGAHEADYVPDSAGESPPETVRANGSSYTISNVGNTEEVTTETIDGVTVRTTVIYRDRDTTTPEYSERVEQPANIVLPTITTSTTLITESLIERDWTYSTLKSRLEQEVETIRKPVAAVFPGQSFATPTQLVIETRTTTDYLYTVLDIIRERQTRLEVAVIAGINVLTALAQITTERWQKIGPEEYNYTRSQVNRDGTVSPLPQRRSGFTNTQPPATQYRPAEKQRTENSYRGEATFESLAGSDFGEKLWSIQLPSGMVTGNAQCRSIAELWGRIRHGRQFAVNWAADITAAWLQSFTPVRRVDFSVPTPGVGWVRSAYLVESLTIDIDARSAAIGGRGIEIGQIGITPFDSETPPVVQVPGGTPEVGLGEPVAPVELQNSAFVGLLLGGVGVGAELELGPIPITVGLALGSIGIGVDVEAVAPEIDATVGLALGSVGIGADAEAVQPPAATVGLALGSVGIGAAMASTVSATVGLSLGGVGIGGLVTAPSWTPADTTTAQWIEFFDPTKIFNSSSGGSLPSADGAILRAEDKSGNARHITATNGPARKVSTQGGKDGALFDGVNDRMGRSGFMPNTFTIIAVLKKTDLTNDQTGWLSQNSNTNNAGRLIVYGERDTGTFRQALQVGGTLTTNTGTRTGGFNVVSYTRDGATVNFYYNGGSAVSGSTSTNTVESTTFSIGAANNSGTDFSGQEIMGWVIIDGVASDDIRQRIEGYFAHKLGLESVIDADHPYRTNPPTL